LPPGLGPQPVWADDTWVGLALSNRPWYMAWWLFGQHRCHRLGADTNYKLCYDNLYHHTKW
jgi:hypothetical protein